MADTKASAFAALSALTTGDKFVVIDDPSGTPVQKTCTIDVLALYFGSVGFGETTTLSVDVTGITGTPKLTATSDNNAALNMVLIGNGNNVTGPSVALMKTRTSGSTNANTVVQNGDYCGSFLFYAAGGTDYHCAGIIRMSIDGSPGASDVPGRMSFLVTPDGAASPTERLTILPIGAVCIGTQTTPTANGSKILVFGDNTANPTLGTNTAAIFAKDVAGTVEMFACDEAGNVTQISPHGDLDEAEAAGIVLEPEDLAPAVAHSENIYTGVHTYRYTGPSGRTQVRQVQREPKADWEEVQNERERLHRQDQEAYRRAVNAYQLALAAYEAELEIQGETKDSVKPIFTATDPGEFVRKPKPRWR